MDERTRDFSTEHLVVMWNRGTEASAIIELTWVEDMAEQADIDERAFNEAVRSLENIADIAMGGPEGLEHAACSPKVKYLAEVGMGAAARGCSADGWRTEVTKTLDPDDADRELEEAEECMRHSGLWPWN